MDVWAGNLWNLHAIIRMPKVVQQKFDNGKSENSSISKK